jgi:fermentation-respiration switch protein FrsA (DUF1100 family)
MQDRPFSPPRAQARRTWRQHPVVRLVRGVAVVYCVMFALALLFSERLIFVPPAASYVDGPAILKLDTGTGSRISGVFLPQKPGALTVLFSHGNGEDLGYVRPALDRLHALGFAVLAYDYEGYGTSDGKPSEDAAYRDVDAAYHYATDELHIRPESLIAYGRSLGGGPSVDLASRRPLGGLVLESTFVGTWQVMTHWPLFPFDRFRSKEKLARVHCPVLVMHGTADRVVPYWHGVALAAAANEPKRFWGVEGADHLELMTRPGYDETLESFAALVRASTPPSTPGAP